MKKEKTTEEILGDYGVRQFVRNRMGKVLLDNANKGKEGKRVIVEINEDIRREFGKIARDEAEKVLAEIKTFNKKQKEKLK